MTTVDKIEIEKFSKLAKEWWNPSGKFKPLHLYNPSRIEFIKEKLISHFKLKMNTKEPLKNINILLSPVKTIIAIRNMEPFFYKKYNNEISLNIISFIRKFFSKISMLKADKILAVSEFSKNYLMPLIYFMYYF